MKPNGSSVMPASNAVPVLSYALPIPLVQYIRMGKQFIKGKGDGGHNPFYKFDKK